LFKSHDYHILQHTRSAYLHGRQQDFHNCFIFKRKGSLLRVQITCNHWFQHSFVGNSLNHFGTMILVEAPVRGRCNVPPVAPSPPLSSKRSLSSTQSTDFCQHRLQIPEPILTTHNVRPHPEETAVSFTDSHTKSRGYVKVRKRNPMLNKLQ
jgi:hypothetical protein